MRQGRKVLNSSIVTRSIELTDLLDVDVCVSVRV